MNVCLYAQVYQVAISRYSKSLCLGVPYAMVLLHAAHWLVKQHPHQHRIETSVVQITSKATLEGESVIRQDNQPLTI